MSLGWRQSSYGSIIWRPEQVMQIGCIVQFYAVMVSCFIVLSLSLLLQHMRAHARQIHVGELAAATCGLWLAAMALFISPTRAAESALGGLGEPADPASMAQPTQLFPQSSLPSSGGSAQAPLRTGGSAVTQPPVINNPTNTGPTDAPTNSTGPSLMLRPRIEREQPTTGPFTLVGAIQYADQNYPTIKKSLLDVSAAKLQVGLQKLNEYLPDSLAQYQLLFSSHDKITQMFYGSPVFPADPGPGTNNYNLTPYFYSGLGFSVDWAPLDFGLHKARIEYSKTQYRQAQAGYAVTKLDVEIAAASAFLDVVQAMEQVQAMEENVASFKQFYDVVHAQVSADLKPGADQSLATAQLANAENQLLRARLSQDLAIASLANTLGLGGQYVIAETKGITTDSQPRQTESYAPVFENVPIVQASQAVLTTAMAQKKVLNKEYAPVFHFLGGFNFRGSGENLTATGGQSQGAAGVFPYVPNFQLAMIVNWNFLDWFRIRQEKRIQNTRIAAQQQELNLTLQNIKTEDLKARAQIKTAIALADNMPVQVEAAIVAARQAQARYQTGLGSVAQVAEANTVLAQSRMQEAIARIGVWRALLQVASVRGDLRPFMAEAERIQKGI